MAKRPAPVDGFDKRPARVVEKPRDKPRDGIPGRNGGTLRNGGTNAGGPGRPPNEFKALMQTLASRVAQASYMAEVLDDPKHPHWAFAVKHVTEHGYGKPTQPMEHTGAVGSYVVRLPAKAKDAETWAREARGE